MRRTGPLLDPTSPIIPSPRLTVVTVTTTKNPDSLPSGVNILVSILRSTYIAATIVVTTKHRTNTGNVSPKSNPLDVPLLPVVDPV